LTAGRFVPNPFASRAGSRLYRTGDLARYLPDGNIEFLGRVDHQVKIRGFRVELGEIDATLEQHPAVQEAVALVREDRLGNQRLVAYVVPDTQYRDTERHGTELRSYLQNKLPDYMMPSLFVVLDSMPLTPNGKIDRQALPAPHATYPELAETFVPPRTPVEEMLSSIWTQLLGVEQVGIHDSFFELGGHSLLLTQLTSRIRQVFRVELPLRSLFDAPTVAEMAKAILTKQIEQTDKAEVEQLREKIRQLTPEEAKALLNRSGFAP
ncbi:MAG: AMP-binding protein, partial [bacterium]|nr:AMP-binding protein [bacterium]